MRYRNTRALFLPQGRVGPTQLLGTPEPTPEKKNPLKGLAWGVSVLLFVGSVANNLYLHHKDRELRAEIERLKRERR